MKLIHTKILVLLLAATMMFSLGIGAFAAEEAPVTAPAVTVYYTNDVHTYIAEDNGYAKLAALYKSTDNALLVDAGDHLQGTAYGSSDQGASVARLMEAAGYDLATLGNHDFDYGMARALEVAVNGGVPYVSCNFYHEKDGVTGDLVLDPYRVFDVAGRKIAFVGITTPESFTKSTPRYFQDENGNYIYAIAGGSDGTDLYAAVQKAIDAAAAEADIVIALGHLGDNPASVPWTSEDVIANVSGLSAFIDGHSHSVVPSKAVSDKDGHTVILTQTGLYFGKVGKMTIEADGSVDAELIDLSDVEPDAEVAAINDAWAGEVNALLDQKIAETEIDFTITFDNGKRAVRSAETNLGDLNADAFYWVCAEAGLEPDMAIMNGGGVRASVGAGDWSYLTCKTVNTFSNVLCAADVTGQQILDALEFGARFTTGDPENLRESGGFLQVAGCTYTVNTMTDNGVTTDDKNVWLSGPETYRVGDVKIYNRATGTYDPLELNRTYRVCGTNYTLYNCGDGFNMFQDSVHVLDGIAEDYMAFADYLQAFEGGVISSASSPLAALDGYLLNYENAAGAGRITLKVNPFSDVDNHAYYTDAVLWAADNGITKGTSDTAFSPDAPVTREQAMTFLYRHVQNLGDGFQGAWMFPLLFDDAEAISDWADESIHWGVMNQILLGDDANRFNPAVSVTREQLVTILYRFAQSMGCDVSVDPNTNFLSYNDVFSVSEYAATPMFWALENGILTGDPQGNLLPQAPATRAQFVTILYRFLSAEK